MSRKGTEPRSQPKAFLIAKLSVTFDSYCLDIIAEARNAQKTHQKKRQTQAVIRRILLSKLQHANISFAFCFLQTQSEKISREKGEKTSSTIHASQSPVGYYHVLNCELQTQAVLKQEQKEKADGFFLHPVKLFLNASVCSLLPSWHCPCKWSVFCHFEKNSSSPHPPYQMPKYLETRAGKGIARIFWSK